MRLLHTTELRVQYFSFDDVPKYAILSHTWGTEEVTFQDMENQTFRQKNGFQKIQNCCKVVANDGYTWVWIDTCTIDKSSTAELDEALGSMFSWYQHSSVCYAILEDLEDIQNLGKSKWFTRGWTLQELIAPHHFLLFGRGWKKFGTKQDFSDQISHITGIPDRILRGASPLTCNVAQRMSWASTRMTTRDEDKAYCLLGLFGVQMPSLYGEGLENAFLRLQEKIMNANSDQTLFLWAPSHEPYNQGLLATSPSAFCRDSSCSHWHFNMDSPKDPFDPYSTFRPIFVPGSDHLVLDADGADVTRESGMIESPLGSACILGPHGLKISLLAKVRNPDAQKANGATNARLFGLDVMCTASNGRSSSPPKFTRIGLRLCRDHRAGLSQGFVPNRLGNMRRFPSTSAMSRYVTDLRNVSLKRERVVSSQVKTTGARPGAAVLFHFRDIETNNLIPRALHTWTDSDSKKPLILPTTVPFLCRGGLVEVAHFCRVCSQKILLAFGTRERNRELWCHFWPSEPFEKLSERDVYLYNEQLSARYNDRSHIKLNCDGWVLAVVQRAEEDGQPHSIRIDFKTTLNDVHSYFYFMM